MLSTALRSTDKTAPTHKPFTFDFDPDLLRQVLMKNHRVKMGREDEAKYVLTRLRGGDEDSLTKGKAEAEFEDIRNVAELERKAAGLTSYWAMFLGKGSGKLHTGRRVQLVIWLQILQVSAEMPVCNMSGI